MAMCVSLNMLYASDPVGPGNGSNSGREEGSSLSIEQIEAEELALAVQMRSDYPDDDDALLFEGRVHLRQGRFAEAVRCWQQALKINPKQARAYHELALMAKTEGQFEQAVDYWRRGVRVQPRAVIMRTMLGYVLLEMNKPDEALVELQRGLPADPESASWHYVIGECYMKLQEYARAKAHYEEAITILPEDMSSYYGLTKACTRLGLKDEAVRHMDVFRRLKAADLEWRRTLALQAEAQRMTGQLARRLVEAGKLCMDKGHLGRAEAVFKRAVILQPQQRAPREELARIYLQRREDGLALEQYEMISRNEPENIWPYMNIGSIRTRRRELPQAKAAYEKVIELAPQRDLGYRQLARMYLVLDTQPEQARQLAAKAISMQTSAENYFYLAWACRQSGDADEALRAIQEAVRLAPGNRKYQQALGDLERGTQ
jgi:tetratricopeptide (TPR) repeat protein